MRFILMMATLCVALFAVAASAQTVRVVNMVPAALSNETNQDSEPDLAINPNDFDEIVASAFTPNPSGATATAPVYISQDQGNIWWLNNIVPSGNGMTGDITVSLSRNEVLYAGILRGGSGLDMRILRSSAYTGGTAMTQLLGRTSEDQPYARAYSPMGGPQRNLDHLYVGHNDFNNAPRTASIEQSLDAETAPAPAGLSTIRLERRTPDSQDGPPIRQAIHPDGTVYSAYSQITNIALPLITGNVVVVRDDDWGQGAAPYSDLTDPGDAVEGRMVVSGITWVWNSGTGMGQARLGDRLSIAVDPRDSDTVYVAWADRPPGVTGNTATVHVRRSTDGGNNWSADLLTAANSIAPQLAVTIRGDVGFAYQQLVANRWETHFQQSTDGGTTWTDFTLSDTPSTTPVATFSPYLGDYMGLTAAGKDFYGVFSANNTPNNGNFPNGVTYQRSANFTTNQLDDGAGNPVNTSIDPFFYHIENVAENQDFYVRDWTDSATDNDNGVEPSTDSIFYTTSDVWNRRSDVAGGFTASDRPISEDPQPTTLGGNFAFARVHRKDTGTADTVTLHFLKSEFGTGSNYIDAGTAADPTLSFAAGDMVQTMSSGSGYPWDLITTASTHTCLAVEISTASDPIVAPGLLGRAPGWPDTDLMVIYDNNKAQRNMGVHTLGSGVGGSVTFWAVVHNAATHTRDLVLQFVEDPAFLKRYGEAELVVAGDVEYYREGDRIVFADMTPCDNAWIGLRVPVMEDHPREENPGVTFGELVGNQVVNGFKIAMRHASPEEAAGDSVRLLITNLQRLGAILELSEALELAKIATELVESGKADPERYVDFLREFEGPLTEFLKRVIEESEDAFALSERLKMRNTALRRGGPTDIVVSRELDLDHALDAALTWLNKREGDVADVAQTMRWQAALLRGVGPAADIPGIEEAVKQSENFDLGYALRELTAKDYQPHLMETLPVLRELSEIAGVGGDALKRLEDDSRPAQLLQGDHCRAILELDDWWNRRNEAPFIKIDERAVDAPFVFRGTVLSRGESTLDSLPADKTTYVVRIDEVLLNQGRFVTTPGALVTVVDPNATLAPERRYTLFTEPFRFGKSVAAHLVDTSSEIRLNRKDLTRAKDERTLHERLKQATIAVIGTVQRVEPVEMPRGPLTEHDPMFSRAVLRIDQSLRGDAPDKEVTFIFATSRDVHWFRSPKFNKGDTGAFFLKPAEKDIKGLAGMKDELVLLDARDYYPASKIDLIRSLMK